ncbi:PREDICTED: RNA exonuclease 4-like isoform X2 [Branchiostoma belcheri]|uniref:RNA exonuclease 4 n=1 Tax=Branchiostoma belcheri TaxID=7741 RepID=A0A6P4ZJW0_BRABE|nr:PREDICTED: RNA exonuclease 4-like isoform X2 [Branchiostoma belcheri]
MERVVTYLIGRKKKKSNKNDQPSNSIINATTQQNGIKKSKNRRRIWKKKHKKQEQKTVQLSSNQNVKEQTSSETRTVSITPNNVTVSIGQNVSQKSQGNKKEPGKKKNWRVVKWGRRPKKTVDSSTAQTAPQPMVPKKGEDFSSNWKKLAAETQVSSKTSQQSAKKRKSNQKESPRKRTKLRDDKGQGTSQEQSSHPDLWFVDDLDVEDIEVTLGSDVAAAARKERGLANRPAMSLVKPDSFDGLTRAVGMDCEMVGTGHRGSKSALARVSIVNQFGKCVYDKFVKPKEKVTDYRTFVSGIRPRDLKDGESFQSVQKEVADILKGRILVGHALQNDMKALQMTHPKQMIRDTSNFPPFKSLAGGNNTPSLKKLAAGVLHLQIQKGEHCSIQDAQVAMRLYTLHKKEWEAFCRPGAKGREVQQQRNSQQHSGLM